MAQVHIVPVMRGEPDSLSVTLEPASGNVAVCGDQLYEAALSGLLKRELSGVERAIANAVNDCFDGFNGVEDAGVRLRALTGLIEKFRLEFGSWNRPRQQKEH